MKLRKLDNSFYTDNYHLYETLDNQNGRWVTGKVRGYGIVIISFETLTFAIPLRSRIQHRASYITIKSNDRKNPQIIGKGLDYSKALLITKESYISDLSFKIAEKEHKKISNKENFIKQRFEKYVSNYIRAVKGNITHVLDDKEYRFTTLINYHSELNL